LDALHLQLLRGMLESVDRRDVLADYFEHEMHNSRALLQQAMTNVPPHTEEGIQHAAVAKFCENALSRMDAFVEEKEQEKSQ
jgi:hypothetical protein